MTKQRKTMHRQPLANAIKTTDIEDAPENDGILVSLGNVTTEKSQEKSHRLHTHPLSMPTSI